MSSPPPTWTTAASTTADEEAQRLSRSVGRSQDPRGVQAGSAAGGAVQVSDGLAEARLGLGTGDEVALHVVAADRGDGAELVLGLDALDDHDQARGVGGADHELEDALVTRSEEHT